MTICFSVANQEGIVMAAERRSLTVGYLLPWED